MTKERVNVLNEFNRGFTNALKYIVYITQLGFSMVIPMVLSLWLANLAKEKFGWGDWILIIAIIIGAGAAIINLVKTLSITLLKPEKTKLQDTENEKDR